MNPAIKLLIPLAVGAGALFAFTGKASAKPTNGAAPGSTTAPGMPPELVAKIATAVATADPVQMRKVADEVQKAGFPAQAESLRQAARDIEKVISQAPGAAVPGATPAPPGPTPPAAPPIVIPTTGSTISPGMPQLPGTQPPAASPSPERNLAAQMVRDLSNTKAGAENKGVVSAFQVQEKTRGYYVGNIDGLYGPKSALALANDYGIVPPKPRYWPKKNPAQAKRDYSTALLVFAIKDPVRAEEWQQAAKV